jgi:hypothetical protein
MTRFTWYVMSPIVAPYAEGASMEGNAD